ncbi:hypothetical protein [Agromyces kandeliae]|uniref:Uncharacterized protein n=1 Tax=Agromyces kandeliae TaxID=2666141 RepID=A0A6L5R1I1_9MICO|nr:hypothetical protein [Agromyces kandeliae]MRX43926.1 hypothetical protein [Agromyces kandeliae]
MDEPDEPEALEPDAPDFAELERVDEPDDFEPVDFEAVDFEAVDFEAVDFAPADFAPADSEAVDFDAAEDFAPVSVVEDPSEIWRTSFLALSSTASLTSPTRAIAKSFTVWTPSCTAGWFQTFSAAFWICS